MSNSTATADFPAWTHRLGPMKARLADAGRSFQQATLAQFEARLGHCLPGGLLAKPAAGPHSRERIPDPNAPQTFEDSRPNLTPGDYGIRHSTQALYRQLLLIRHREIIPRLPGAHALGVSVLGEGAISARWQLGDGSMLHIELNLSANAVAHRPQAQAQLLFEYPPQACTRLQQGTLAPYCALVSLTAAASMLPPAGERQ
jgi:maltooligosyltrehalose trehalohydrolase